MSIKVKKWWDGIVHLDNIILHCLKKLNGERTIYSIYHLLNGKKSSQTIQDAHLFSLKKFFHILDSLTRETFDKLIEDLHTNNLISECGEQRYLLTKSGETLLSNGVLPLFLNGWRYHQISTVFWQRLSLLVQVVSNLAFKETRYVPIQKNKEVHSWIKAVLIRLQIPKREVGKALFKELLECFEGEKSLNPSFLVFRLTGYQQIGLTLSQMAKNFNMDPGSYHIEFLNILHFLIQKVDHERKRFPLLSMLLEEIPANDSMTQSSRKTWLLLNEGYSIDQIAERRNLKVSTIEDHLVEFALHLDNFSIDRYVEMEVQKKIIEISRRTGSKQLKQIRKELETASYFQIRLVLAKYGDKQWN